MIPQLVLLALAFALGYTARCIRPYQTLAHTAFSKTVGWSETGHLTAWALAWCVLEPRRALHSWRHRKDPPPEPVALNPAFFAAQGKDG